MLTSIALTAALLSAQHPPAPAPSAQPVEPGSAGTAAPSATGPISTPAPTTAPPLAAPSPLEPAKRADAAAPANLIPRAQVRVRGEMIGDRQLGDAPTQFVITHRARIGLTATAGDLVTAVLDVQDVRAWGGERLPEPPVPQDRTVYGVAPDGLNLHQGYVGVQLPALELRAGRQEIAIANERLIGPLDWAQRARAFDAVRALSRNTDGFNWTAFFALIGDHDISADIDDVVLAAAAAEFKVLPALRLSPTLVADADLTISRLRGTAGARADGSSGGFNYDGELYGQVTSLAADVTWSGLLGLRASYGFDTFAHPRFGGVLDVVSGFSTPGTAFGSFDTLFATNHKFYGFQDLFLNLPLHTKNRGLIDAAVVGWFNEGPLSVSSFLHLFLPASFAGADLPMYGVEPDFVVSWKPMAQLAIEVGASVFFPLGDGLGRGDRAAPWGYGQVTGSI